MSPNGKAPDFGSAIVGSTPTTPATFGFPGSDQKPGPFTMSSKPKTMVDCKFCKKPFYPRSWGNVICPECKANPPKVTKEITEESARKKQYYESTIIRKNRNCHDCGRPTNNYRCASCLRKWKIRYCVPLDEEDGYV